MWGCLLCGQSGDPKAAAASFRGAKGPLNPSLYPAAAMLQGCTSECVFPRQGIRAHSSRQIQAELNERYLSPRGRRVKPNNLK